MIDIDNLTSGIAADIVRGAGVQSQQIENIVRVAFRRCLALRSSTQPKDKPLHREGPPWTAR